MSVDRAQDHTYVPPITFAELCAAGRISVPGADEDLHDELDATNGPARTRPAGTTSRPSSMPGATPGRVRPTGRSPRTDAAPITTSRHQAPGGVRAMTTRGATSRPAAASCWRIAATWGPMSSSDTTRKPRRS